MQLELDNRSIAKTNPVTGEVTIFKDGAKYKVGYKMRKEFTSKKIEKDGFRAKHESNKD